MITALIAITLLLACNKNDDNDDMTLSEGMYIGTFHRTGMDTSVVTLTLDGNKFNGQSDRKLYPAICSGTYEYYENTIRFTDSCTWTANFDWTLILNGPYSVTRKNNELRFSRTVGNIIDEYVLTKTPR